MKTIGIFCAGQAGDALTISSVLKYREQLWGDCKIVWYISDENRDLLKYQDIELRTFPRGFGYPERTKEENLKNEGTNEPLWEDWAPLVNEHNHLNLELAKRYSSLTGITQGYFPAPHQHSPQQRHGLEYPNISKKVFGVPYDWAWHPVIDYSAQELHRVKYLFNSIEPERKNIAFETYAGSGQSILSDHQVRRAMAICEDILGECNFFFLSHKYLRNDELYSVQFHIVDGIYFGGGYTVRQCGLIASKCDLLLSVSSGITVAASAWQLNPTPILQFCGSEICSTRAMALGRFELVTHDNKPLHVAQEEYYEVLKKMLNEIK